MMKTIIAIVAILAFHAVGAAQSQTDAERQAAQRRMQRENEARGRDDDKVQKLKTMTDASLRNRQLTKEVIRDIGKLYREPSAKELKKLRPLDEDQKKYANFLRNAKAGIIRLEPYRGCDDQTKVISAADKCLELAMPGNGSDYSFRKQNYVIGRLADLRLESDAFSSPGVFQLAVFSGLGDIPLEKVGKDTPGMKYVLGLKPAEQIADAVATGKRFEKGIEIGGFHYASALKASDDMTYVLRSIAYRGTVFRSIGGVVFNELELDERGDVTIAFRIVRRHDSGGVTILWRELERRNAPKLTDGQDKAPLRNDFAAAPLIGID